MADPTEYLRLALDPIRLAVLGRAAVGPVDPAVLAGELDVPARKILEAAGRLRESGLLDDDLRLDREALRDVARQIPQVAPASAAVTAGEWTDEEADVLRRFFTGSRLVSIPAARQRRRIVFERLAQDFEPGLRYPEKQVNFMLQLYHADYAALRRGLVDEGFLERADGVYWRAGGRYTRE